MSMWCMSAVLLVAETCWKVVQNISYGSTQQLQTQCVMPENFGFSNNNKNSKYNPTCQFMCFEIQSADCIKCPLGIYKI